MIGGFGRLFCVFAWLINNPKGLFMVNLVHAKLYCTDYTLIENYREAVEDETRTWHCHHRKETDEGLTRTELMEMGLYYHRPPEELIFLTESAHRSLHDRTRPPFTEEWKKKMSEAKKGKKKPKAFVKQRKAAWKPIEKKKVIQLSLNGEFIAEHESVSAAAVSVGLTQESISIAIHKGTRAANCFWDFAQDK